MQTYTTNNDADYIMYTQAEERGYLKWVEEKKKKLRPIHNEKRKQELWSKVWPPYEPSNIPY